MSRFHLDSHSFKQGAKAVLPLWFGTAPVAMAYALAAHDAGLNALDIQLMSMTVYSSAAQMSIVQSLTTGTSTLTLLATLATLHLHYLLYGVSLNRHMPLSRFERAVGAFFLTDGAYGITIDRGTNVSFLLGAEASLFIAWNLFTAVGLLIGNLVALPTTALNFAAPLTFFLLIVSSTKSWIDVAVAFISAALTLLALSLQMGSITILVVGFTGAFIGAWLTTSKRVTS